MMKVGLSLCMVALMENKVFELMVTDYGLYIKLSGRVCKYDIEDNLSMITEILEVLKVRKEFHVLLDCSKLEKPLCSDTANLIASYQGLFLAIGICRTAILYHSNAQIVDLTKIFTNRSVHRKERYISTMINKDAMAQAERYLREGVEP